MILVRIYREEQGYYPTPLPYHTPMESVQICGRAMCAPTEQTEVCSNLRTRNARPYGVEGSLCRFQRTVEDACPYKTPTKLVRTSRDVEGAVPYRVPMELVQNERDPDASAALRVRLRPACHSERPKGVEILRSKIAVGGISAGLRSG